MHPECRQKHLASHNYNQAISIFLPTFAMQGKDTYLKEYYREEIAAEEQARRERELAEQSRQWQARKQQAEAAGSAFDEPPPALPTEPEPWWDKAISAVLFRIYGLPLGDYILPVFIVLACVLALPFFLPWWFYSIQREWRRMHRRDREDQGNAPCDYCGNSFYRSLPGYSP